MSNQGGSQTSFAQFHRFVEPVKKGYCSVLCSHPLNFGLLQFTRLGFRLLNLISVHTNSIVLSGIILASRTTKGRFTARCRSSSAYRAIWILLRPALSGRWRCWMNQSPTQLPSHFRWNWRRRPIFSALGHPIPHLLLVRLHCVRHGWLLVGNCKIGGYSLQSPGVINPVRSPNLTGRFADHPLSPLWWTQSH